MSSPVVTISDLVIAVLRAALPQVTGYDAHVPSETPESPLPTRYWVLYPTPSMYSWEDLGHTSDFVRAEWQITSVGKTRAEAEWIASKTRTALVDQRPALPGFNFELIEHVSSQPIRWDDQVPGRVVLYGVDQYSCNATIA